MKRVSVPMTPDGVLRIPEHLRERLGSGDPASVEFVMHEDGTIEIRASQASLDGIFGPVPTKDEEVPQDRAKAMESAMRLNHGEGFKRILAR